MPQFYSDPSRQDDAYALPDAEVFQLNAYEVAQMDEDLIHEYMKRPAFRLAVMNSAVREKMLSAMIQEEGIEGGWFYWYCFPGCMPEGDPIGPFATAKLAVEDCRLNASD